MTRIPTTGSAMPATVPNSRMSGVVPIPSVTRAAERFQFTVLRVLEKTLTRAEVIGFEQQYKENLGSRAIGLNLN